MIEMTLATGIAIIIAILGVFASVIIFTIRNENQISRMHDEALEQEIQRQKDIEEYKKEINRLINHIDANEYFGVKSSK